MAKRTTRGVLAHGQGCAALEKAFFESRNYARGDLLDFEIWKPWSWNDQKSVLDCKASPCGVKLDAEEARELGAQSESERMSKFLELVRRRAETYKKTGTPKDYEFPAAQFGAAIEPFTELAKKLGLRGKPEVAGKLQARKLIAGGSSAPGASNGRVVRQIIERREVREGSRKEIWIRSVYTDHFFDAWGEWASFSCREGEGWKLEAAIIADLDLLKKKDFISRLGYGKMKSTSESVMQDEMMRWEAEIK